MDPKLLSHESPPQSYGVVEAEQQEMQDEAQISLNPINPKPGVRHIWDFEVPDASLQASDATGGALVLWSACRATEVASTHRPLSSSILWFIFRIL